MKRRIVSSILLALVAMALVAVPVLAIVYRATYTVTSNSTTSYDMLGVMQASNNDWMADNGFMASSANDTRIETLGGLIKPHMVVDNMTLTAIPVPASSQTNLYFTTGNTPLDNFYIIPGYDGYVSVVDEASIELGDNFTIEQRGWVDTSYSVNKTLVYKEGAFQTYISATENITSEILGTSENITYTAGEDGGADVFADNWFAQTFTTSATSGLRVTYVSLKVEDSGNAGNVTVSIRATAAGKPTGGDLASITVDDDELPAAADWHDFTFSCDLDASTMYAIVIRAPDGDAVNKIIWRGDFTGATYVGGTYCKDGSGGGWASQDDDDFMFDISLDVITAEVTATGVSSDVHTVKTVCEQDTWLYFDGTNDEVDCGNDSSLESGSSNWTIECWVNIKEIDAVRRYIVSFTNQASLRLSNVDNRLEFAIPGVAAATKDTTALIAGRWYHVVAVWINGVEVFYYIDGDEKTSPAFANTSGVAVGNLRLGEGTAGAENFQGLIDEVRLYRRALEEPEIKANYNLGRIGVPQPNNTANLTAWWHIDEGTGVTIYDETANSNDGTITGATWNGTELKLYVDDMITPKDMAFLSGGNVTDTSANWTFFNNNVMPYCDNMTISVNGTQQLWFDPISMILGTNLPDRATSATNNGTFHWGSNPTGVSVSLGSLVSSAQPTPGVSADRPTQDILPEVEVTDWFIEPDVGGTLLTHPLRPFVTIMSDTTTLTERQAWVLLALAFVLFVTVLTATNVRGHQGITAIVLGAAIGLVVSQTIFPMWALVFAIGAGIFGLISERSPSL